MYTKSKLYVNYRLWVILKCQCSSWIVTNVPLRGGMSIVGEVVHVWRHSISFHLKKVEKEEQTKPKQVEGQKQ